MNQDEQVAAAPAAPETSTAGLPDGRAVLAKQVASLDKIFHDLVVQARIDQGEGPYFTLPNLPTAMKAQAQCCSALVALAKLQDSLGKLSVAPTVFPVPRPSPDSAIFRAARKQGQELAMHYSKAVEP